MMPSFGDDSPIKTHDFQGSIAEFADRSVRVDRLFRAGQPRTMAPWLRAVQRRTRAVPMGRTWRRRIKPVGVPPGGTGGVKLRMKLGTQPGIIDHVWIIYIYTRSWYIIDDNCY